MEFFKRISFWKKFIIVGVIPLALLGIVVGSLSYVKAGRVVQQSVKRVLSDTINRIDININVKARLINSFMETVGESAPIVQLIEWQEAGAVGEYTTNELRLFCENTLGSFEEITDVNIFVGERGIYSSTERSSIPNTFRLGELYVYAREYPGKVIWSDVAESVYIAKEDVADNRIIIYEGIMNSQGETIGLVVVEVDPRTFGSAILTKQKIYGYQTTFITDRTGNIIYSDNTITKECLQEILMRYHIGERKSVFSIDGKGYYFCSQYNGLIGWVTFTMIPEDHLFPEAHSLRSYTIALVGISVFLAATCLMFLSIAITKPLERLKNGMKQVQDKNFELQLENDREDEIGELTDTFNLMVNRIHILVNQVYEEKLAQKNAEIEALQAQINPHFLYNTLDSINWMLIDKDEMDVSTIIVALGKLMQYSMDTRTSMVSLLDEYRYVKDYLLIQKYRFEDQMEFHLELAPELETFKVPKLILQPLIENAIDHGIAAKSESGTVQVRSYHEGENVCIMVKDNGRGMTPEEFSHYQRMLQNDADDSHNIGVRNVARRLQLHFNDRCKFQVENKLGEGVTVTITIPADA